MDCLLIRRLISNTYPIVTNLGEDTGDFNKSELIGLDQSVPSTGTGINKKH